MIRIHNGITRHPDWRMAEPINLEILQGEQIAIAGDNAAGKSRLIEVLTGHFPLLMNEVKYDFSPSPLKMVSENLKYITFRDSYGDNDGTYYYQLRWNQHDIDENTPTAGQLLQEAFRQADESIGRGLSDEEREAAWKQRTAFRKKLTDLFHLDGLMDKYIISLSSGEMRKFQLTRTLGTGPRVLIMDNPFIGLDAQTRDQLRDLLRQLTSETPLLIILVLSKVDDIPAASEKGVEITPLRKERMDSVSPTERPDPRVFLSRRRNRNPEVQQCYHPLWFTHHSERPELDSQ